MSRLLTTEEGEDKVLCDASVVIAADKTECLNVNSLLLPFIPFFLSFISFFPFVSFFSFI